MLSKNEVKYIQSLCHKKQRDEQQLFIAEGPKLAEEILHSDFDIVKVFATHEWLVENSGLKVPSTEVTGAELERISGLQTPNKVLVIAKQKVRSNEPTLSNKLTLVLDGIQDPGNMGTIIRIADWFGIEQLVASNDTVEVYNPKVVQATMGSICRVKVWYKELSLFLANAAVPVYGALLDGQSIYTIAKPNEGLLVIGNEGRGIRQDVIPLINKPVTIPKKGGAESLNAAVATGIILSHLLGDQ